MFYILHTMGSLSFSYIWNCCLGSYLKKYTRRVFILQKRAVRCVAGLGSTDTCRESFVRLWILTLYSLYILEVILFIKNKDAAITNRQVHNHLTRNSSDYHQLPHNLEIYNNRSAIAGCKLYNKLPAHIKLIRDDRLFKKKN
jgi:hypothetical protein